MISHQAIYNIYPEIASIIGDRCLDNNGSEVEIDNELIQTEINRLKAELDKTEYQRLRQPEYPSLADLADAIYWQSKGDDSKMTLYLQACEDVKNQYPKPEDNNG